jgi:hypothetical protein
VQVVELGTLTRTDLLMEAVFALLKRSPLHVFRLPLWLLRDKAALKQAIADRVELDVTLLPYNQPYHYPHLSGDRVIPGWTR